MLAVIFGAKVSVSVSMCVPVRFGLKKSKTLCKPRADGAEETSKSVFLFSFSVQKL